VKKLLLAACFLVGCAAKPTTTFSPTKLEVEPDVRGIVALISEYGIGHACPTTRGTFSNAHVVRYHPWDPSYGTKNFTWADRYGNSGVAIGKNFHTDRDVGEVILQGRSPAPYDIAKPVVGEKVWWVDYDYDSETYLEDKVRTAHIQSVFADIIIITEVPKPGASGGCLLNQWGEALGVVAWGMNVDSGPDLGAAVVFPPTDDR
jgi:hypothetical protein